MNTPDSLQGLARQVRWLKLQVICLAALLGVLLLGAAASIQKFDELNVERLNIVDASGKPRLVLANAERLPPPMLKGKSFKRAVNPAGIIFYNAAGDEVGGLALTDLQAGRLSALSFDYSNMDAMGLLTHISPDGKDASAGLVINSRPDESLDPASAGRSSVRRIELQNHNEVAELVMMDTKGRPRVRLYVDKNDQPVFEMLDEKGAAVYTLRK
jgi:hypothetical protein